MRVASADLVMVLGLTFMVAMLFVAEDVSMDVICEFTWDRRLNKQGMVRGRQRSVGH